VEEKVKCLIAVHALHRTGSTAMHRFIRFNIGKQYITHRHLLINRWHRSYSKPGKELIEKYGKKNWKVVHLVRDPIARNLSHFWVHDFRVNVKPNAPDLSTFKERFLVELDHYYPLDFIGNEIEPYWEIEIPFTHGFHSPYTIYDDRVAIMRYEDFDCRNDLLRNFLRVEPHKEPPRIQCAGRAGEVDDYREILDTIRLPEMYIDLIYASAYARTFYSSEEIKVLKERWTKGIKADHPIIQKQEAIRNAHNPETCQVCIQFREMRYDKENKRNHPVKE
jgi:hypothetical protein